MSIIKASAPGKIHLLGEHAAVYGKPALLSAVNLRATATISPCHSGERQRHQNLDSGRARFSLARMTKTIEPIIKKHLKIKTIPPYQLTISSQIPIGSGLGSSASLSASYIAALLSFLKIKWNKKLINELTFEAEKVFHGNPSGGDNTSVVYGGLIQFQKNKTIKSLKMNYSVVNYGTSLRASSSVNHSSPQQTTRYSGSRIKIPKQLSENIILINTGKPKESTKEMVEIVATGYKSHAARYKKIFDHQEKLVKELIKVLKNWNENKFIEIIKSGEKNLEEIGVVSPFVTKLIRKIENLGGSAKICGGGGKTKATGIILAYHPDKMILEKIAKNTKLDFFNVSLGSEGVKIDK